MWSVPKHEGHRWTAITHRSVEKQKKRKKKMVLPLRGFKSAETQTPTCCFVFSYFSSKHLWRGAWFRNLKTSAVCARACLRRLIVRSTGEITRQQICFVVEPVLFSPWLKSRTLVKIDPRSRSCIFWEVAVGFVEANRSLSGCHFSGETAVSYYW